MLMPFLCMPDLAPGHVPLTYEFGGGRPLRIHQPPSYIMQSVLRQRTTSAMLQFRLAPSARTFFVGAYRSKSATDSVKDAAKKVDNVAANAALKGIDAAETMTNKTKEAVGVGQSEAKQSASEAKGKVSEMTGEVKGKAAELKGEAKKKMNENM